MSKFFLILGTSGTGKSSIIRSLINLDKRFEYISPYTTRPLREGEKDKKYVSDDEMDKMNSRDEFLVINELYGIRYGTPKKSIFDALAKDCLSIIDWPVSKLGLMEKAFPDQLFVVYISPPSVEELRLRITKDGRDKDGSRLRDAIEELGLYRSHQYHHHFDLEIVSENGKVYEAALRILDAYKKSFE